MRMKPLAAVLLAAAALVGCEHASASKTTNGQVLTKENVNPAATQAAPQQLSFATRDQAVAALMAAAKTDDNSTLRGLFGPAVDQLISPDKVQAANALASFEQKATEKMKVEQDKPDTAVLYIGKEEWPFPIPVVKGKDGKWFFDTEAGKTEILARRIGDDELQTIEVCRAYVLAQREYGSKDRDGDGVLNYAQRIVSHEGTHDGLYWKAVDDQEQSPLGPLMAQAESEGYDPAAHTPRSGEPYHGYYFRILTKQGPAAPNGAYNYVINGKMIAGFALVASPAEYGKTGIMTFIVSHQGKVYEKNLGPRTAEMAGRITEYNPDSTWHLVSDAAPIASDKE